MNAASVILQNGDLWVLGGKEGPEDKGESN